MISSDNEFEFEFVGGEPVEVHILKYGDRLGGLHLSFSPPHKNDSVTYVNTDIDYLTPYNLFGLILELKAKLDRTDRELVDLKSRLGEDFSR